MSRGSWEFAYTIKDLISASRKKLDHHSKRLEHYQKQMAAFTKELKKRGLQLTNDEPIASLYTVKSVTTTKVGYSGYSGYSGTGGIGYQGNGSIMVEDALTKKLNYLNGELKRHIQGIKDFDYWLAVLEAQPGDQELKLSPDDWHFFFAS